MGTRKYRMTPEGEKPIWASGAELVRLGQEWAELHLSDRTRAWSEPCAYGNLIHDEACARRWQIRTGKFPSWFKAGAA